MAKERWRLPAYFGAGLFGALPVLFTQLSFLAFFSLIPVCFLLWRDLCKGTLSLGKLWGTGLVFSMGYFIAAFHWFTYLWPLDFVSGMTETTALLVIVAACIGLPFLQSVTFALLFLLLGLLKKTGLFEKYPFFFPFAFAAAWVVAAYSQTLTWAGVPWAAQLALSQQKCLFFLQSASLFGSYFVTFCLAAINGLFALAVTRLASKEKKAALSLSLLAVILFVGNTGLGAVAAALPLKTGGEIKIAVLQGNLASAEKWNSGVDAISIYAALADEAAEDGATVMIWPETAVTSALSEGSGALNRVRQIASKTNAVQIVGAFSYRTGDDGANWRYNSLYLVHPDGTVNETLYDKRHLVPFGEYVPMESVIRACLPFLSNLEMLKDGSTIHEGLSPSLFEEEFGTFGGLICFDTIYESLARDSVKAGAEVLVIGTNDSWFSNSAAVYMHNGQAVLRAVENRRYVARAANTGISSIITPYGEEIVHLDPLIRGEGTATVTIVESHSLYTEIGDAFVLLSALFLLGIGLSPLLKRKKDK